MSNDSYSIHVAVDSTDAVTATRNLNGMEQATGRSERALLRLGTAARLAGAALIGVGIKSAIQEMVSFETQMLKLKSLTDATTQQMKAMEKQARELGAATAFSAQQAADAQGVLASAGLKTNEILMATPKVLQLAAAGSLELASAADIAMVTIRAMGLQLSDLGHINDIYAKVAADSAISVEQIGAAMAEGAPSMKAFGVSIETTAAAIGILKDNGIKIGSIGDGLKSLMGALANETKANATILETHTIGIDKHKMAYKDLNVEVLGIKKVLENFKSANFSAAESVKLFGLDAFNVGVILANNVQKLDDTSKALKITSGDAQRQADILNQGLSKAWDALKGTLSEAALQLGDAGVTGALTNLIQKATGVIAIYEGMGAKFAESNGYTKEQYENLKKIASELETVAAGAGGIAVLTAGIWAANTAMIAFNIAARANPLVLVATAGAATIGIVIDKIGQQKKAHEEFMTSSNTMEEQNLKIKTQIAKVLSVTPNGTPNAAAKSMIDAEKENLRILVEQRTAIEAKTEADKAQEQVTATQTKSVKANTKATKDKKAAEAEAAAAAEAAATKDKTAANKAAAAATKALAEAEVNFKAQQEATVAASEITGKLLEGQSRTQLLALSEERKAIEDKAKVSMATATEQATKNAITQQTQDALFASLDKTRAIQAAIIAQDSATIDVKIAAAQAELDTADKYNLTLAEQLRLKSEIAGLQAEKALIPEQMAQLDITTQGSKDEVVAKAAADRIKAISEAQTAANERATAEMAILTANLDAAREAATGLSDAFGSVGASIGDMGIAFASYEKSQAAITDGLEQQLLTIEKMNDGKGDQAKKDKAISDAGAKQDKLQVKSYGDMTKAAQGFFEKGSTGYKALGVATKVFRAFEMAQSAMSMVKMITDNAKMVGAFISGIFQSTAANQASVLPNTIADGTKATASGTAAVAAASAAPFPIGFATGAAMLAFMLAIGVAMSGSASAAPQITGADYQKQQEEAYSASLGGTVLGSSEASNSILDALDIISENSTADLDYSRGMANSLAMLAVSNNSINNAAIKKFGLEGQAGLNIGTTSASNSVQNTAAGGAISAANIGVGLASGFMTAAAAAGSLGISLLVTALGKLVPAIGSVINSVMGFILDPFLGSTKIKREFAGSGIKFVSQTLGSIVEDGIVAAQQYTDVLVTSTTSYLWGLIENSKTKIQTFYAALDSDINKAIGDTIVQTAQSIVSAANVIGDDGLAIQERLNNFEIDLGGIPLGSDAKKNGEILTATISKLADQMALLNPKFLESQLENEGYYQTLMRVTVIIATAQTKLKTLGITATDYSEILQKTGDIEKQMVVQSIIASSKMEDLNTIMGMLPGTADDAIEAFKGLISIKQGLKDIGAASVLLDTNLIVTAGGISALKDSLATYFDLYFKDQDKLVSKTQTLNDSFSKLGLLMPVLNATIDATTGVVTDAKSNYSALLDVLKNDTTARGREIYVLALAMSSDFADAAELNAQLVKDKLAEQTKAVETQYNQQIALYKALGDSEKALFLEREKAALSMNAETKAYTETLNKLVDANAALAESEKGLETAYKGLTAMRDKFVSIGEGLIAYYNELTGTKNPTASPEQIYNATKKAFLDAAAIANTGNAEALASLPSLGKAFLESSKSFNASGDAYQADFNTVLKSLQDASKVTESQITVMNNQLDQAKAANSKLSTLDASVNNVVTAIALLKSTMATFTGAKDAVSVAASDAKILAEAKTVADAKKTAEDKAASDLAAASKTTAQKAADDARSEAIKSFLQANINDPAAIFAAQKSTGITDAQIVAAGYTQQDIDYYRKLAPTLQAEKLAKENKDKETAATAAAAAAAEAARVKAAADRAALLAGYRSNVPTTTAPGGTNNPYWEAVISQFDAEHRAKSGIPMNRGWGADSDAANQYDALKQQYLDSIPALASGGMANGLSLVGERGAELVNFGSPANVTNHSQTAGLFDNISQSIKNSSEVQATLLKEQVIELQALVNLQSSANVAMINELKGMKAEMAELTRKAKLEASS
jgi:TP901 family phage tail tape measure protein